MALTIAGVKRLILLYIGSQSGVLLCIATLWFISEVTDPDVIRKWGLWRLGDVIAVGFACALYFLFSNSRESRGPALLTMTIATAAVTVDGVGLIAFGVAYHDCKLASSEGIVDTDPLCYIDNFEKVSITYTVLSGIATSANALILGIAIGLMLLVMAEEAERIQDETEVTNYDDLVETGATVSDGYAMTLLNGLTVAVVLLSVEATALLPYSRMKFLFLSHIPHAVLFFQSLSPMFKSQTSNSFCRWIAFAAGMGSAIAVILHTFYLAWNCEMTDPPRLFPDIPDCDLGVHGARFCEAMHDVFFVLAVLRYMAYTRISRHQAYGPPEVLDRQTREEGAIQGGQGHAAGLMKRQAQKPNFVY